MDIKLPHVSHVIMINILLLHVHNIVIAVNVII